jgi:hypothetical protein
VVVNEKVGKMKAETCKKQKSGGGKKKKIQ